MKRPRSRFLTHPYPMWQECTLHELILLTMVVVGGIFIGMFLLSVVVGHFSLLVLLSSLCYYHGVLFTAKRFARYKKGKPPHFILLDLSKRFGIGARSRISRVGVWETRRVFREDT